MSGRIRANSFNKSVIVKGNIFYRFLSERRVFDIAYLNRGWGLSPILERITSILLIILVLVPSIEIKH